MINKLILSHIYCSRNKTCRLYSPPQQSIRRGNVKKKSSHSKIKYQVKLKKTLSLFWQMSTLSSLLNSHTLLPPTHVRWCQWWNFLRKLSAQLWTFRSICRYHLLRPVHLEKEWMPWSSGECPTNLQQSAVKLLSNLSTLDYWSCLPPAKLSGQHSERNFEFRPRTRFEIAVLPKNSPGSFGLPVFHFSCG